MNTSLRATALRVALVTVLSLMVATPTVTALTYGFSETNPSICFVESFSTKQDRAVVGEYIWRSGHPLSQYANLQLQLRLPDGTVIGPAQTMMEGSHPFSFRIAEASVVDDLEEVHLCATLRQASSDRRIEDTQPLHVAINVDVQSTPWQTEAVVEALRKEVSVKRDVVDDEEVFSFHDFGGQLKSILCPKVYLQNLEKQLQQMGDQLGNVFSEMESIEGAEGRMRKTSESTFTRVWVWSLFIIATTLIVIYYEFHQLKGTLKRKKKI